MPKTYAFGEKRKGQDLTIKTAEKELFVEWLATPESVRQPASQAKLAIELGVSEQTLRDWKRDPRVASAVRAKIQTHLSLNDLGPIVASLKAQAIDPENSRSVQAAKVLIDLMDRADGGIADVPLGDMSAEELKQLAADLYDQFDERSA